MGGTYSGLFQTLSDNLFLCVAALLFSLMAVVALHEFGHYVFARIFGVRIQKFSLGFGKELWGRTDKHGTRWSLSAIPLGGYVQIFGDVDPVKPQLWDKELQSWRPLTQEELKSAFFMKRVWQRALIVAAGPAINFLLAVLVFAALFNIKGQISTLPIVNAIDINTSGYEAGFKPFDEIVALNGKPVKRFEDIWDYTLNQPGKTFTYTVKRGDKIIELSAVPRPVSYKDQKGIRREHGRVGISNMVAVRLKDITSFNGVNVDGDVEKARALALKNIGKDVKVGMRYSRYEKAENIFLTHIAPETNDKLTDPNHEDYGNLYFWKSKDKFYYRHDTIPKALWAGGKQVVQLCDEGLKIMKVLLTGGGHSEDLGGLATMGGIAGKAAESGLYTFLTFVAVLSVQIGLINLLPVPVLDGGYLLFLAYEFMARKPVPERIKDAALYLGMAILFGIMIIANVNDIFHMTRP